MPAFWVGAGGALPRRTSGGGGGGAEELCFIPPEGLAPPPGGRERSGREGRWERDCSGGEEAWGEGLSGSSWRPGGRGAALRVPGGCMADLPAEPSPTGLSLGTPPWNRPPIGWTAPGELAPPLPLAPPPPPPLGFSKTGALRSLTTPTFFSLAPLVMSVSSAPLPLASSRFSLGGVVLAWLKVGGGGGPPGGGGGGGGIGILAFQQASRWSGSSIRKHLLLLEI